MTATDSLDTQGSGERSCRVYYFRKDRNFDVSGCSSAVLGLLYSNCLLEQTSWPCVSCLALCFIQFCFL